VRGVNGERNQEAKKKDAQAQTQEASLQTATQEEVMR
jgi:hypothetical protein